MRTVARRFVTRGSAAGWLALLVALAFVSVFATAASAYRAPRGSERTQIVAAIHRYLLTQDCKSTGTCRPQISQVRVSLANQSFASAALWVPRVGGSLALLHRRYGTWRVTSLGSADVGCGNAPKAVRVDLELTCPGGK